jgi:hypothetical protein
MVKGQLTEAHAMIGEMIRAEKTLDVKPLSPSS